MSKCFGLAVLLPALLVGCGALVGPGVPSTASSQSSDATENAVGLEVSADADAEAAASTVAVAGWQHVAFPGKTATQFQTVQHAGRTDVVAAYASSSASMLRRKVRVVPDDLDQITFSWMVPQLNTMADMSLRDKDDAVVRVVLAFEGDRSRLSLKDQMLSELALTLTGEEMPYATLMYVWCNRNKVGHIIHSPRTGRIRSMVVESGPGHLNQWLDYKRDIRADYEAVFGEPPGALVGVGIMTDTDNTRTRSRSWYGAVEVTSKND